MADDKLTCPNCGAEVYAADDRCMACGAILDAGALVAPSPPVAEPEEKAATTGGEEMRQPVGGTAEVVGDKREEQRTMPWHQRTVQLVGMASVVLAVAYVLTVGFATGHWPVSQDPMDMGVAAFVMVPAGYTVVVISVVWLALRAVRRSDRPRADKWAAWSLVLGVLCAVGPPLLLVSIWTGIKALRMGGSRWMAVTRIVLGGLVNALYLCWALAAYSRQ